MGGREETMELEKIQWSWRRNSGVGEETMELEKKTAELEEKQ